MERPTWPSRRVTTPREARCRSSASSSGPPLRRPRKTPDAREGLEVEQPDGQEEASGGHGAGRAQHGVDGRATSDQCRGRTRAEGQHRGEHEHHPGVPHGEPEPDRPRSTALGQQLARRVVDGRDVVGVQGVTQAEHVGGDAEADAEDLRAHRQVLRGDDEEQQSETDDVHEQDDRAVGRHLDPVLTTPGPAVGARDNGRRHRARGRERSRVVHGGHGPSSSGRNTGRGRGDRTRPLLPEEDHRCGTVPGFHRTSLGTTGSTASSKRDATRSAGPAASAASRGGTRRSLRRRGPDPR